MRYLMTFSYDGTYFCGYQKQPLKRTVQEELERELSLINNKSVSVCSSGRTDAKVHAYNQKCHFDLDVRIPCNNLVKILNNRLPSDIHVKLIENVDDSFHARFSVKRKEYQYKINIGEYNIFERNYVYQYNKYLDIDLMKRALKILEGTHDFRSFVKLDYNKDTVRTIYSTSVEKIDNIIIISITGNGFLRYMVRNIVGLLIEIGSQKRNVNDVIKILKQKDRTKAGIIAPPEGLYLKCVFYD